MFANNEIGTIQPIEEIGKIAKERNIYIPYRCSSSVGNVPIDVKEYKHRYTVSCLHIKYMDLKE